MRGRRFPTALQHSATHCETLQHTATHGNTRQRMATHCITRHHTASHGTTLQHDAKHCNNNLSPLALFETIDCNTLQQQPEYTCSFSMHSSFSRQYRYGRVMQRDAVCCSVLQCVAVCCSVLQCVAVCCSVLQCGAVCYSVLQCVATQQVAVWCNATTHGNTLQNTATHRVTPQHTATHCNTLQQQSESTGIFSRHSTLKSPRQYIHSMATPQHTATHCKNNLGLLAATHCNTLQHIATTTWVYCLLFKAIDLSEPAVV